MKFPAASFLVAAALPVLATAQHNHPQCGIWMAGSTLGDTTNLGMYAGQDIPKGVDVQREIAIPLLFRDWNEPDYFDTDDGTLWDRYIWEGEVANLETYDNTDLQQTKAVFVPGIGCTINSVLDMNNVDSTHGSTYDTAGLHRSKDPGSGSFTPYYDTHTTSVEPIEAGSEIFAAYGDTWIPEIPGAQVTFNHNLEAAESFLRDDYYRFVQDKKKEMKPEVLEGLWNFTRDFPVNDNHIFTVLPRNVEWKEIEAKIEETSNAQLPDDEEGSDNEGDDDEGPELYDPANMVTRYFIRQQSKRPIDWLQRYGRCCDHMVAGRSNIPQAGRGAFATRDLPKGTTVAYSPLIHVGLHGDDLFNVPYGNKDPKWEPIYDENGKRMPDPPGEEGYVMKDLVINYSFRHPESTIVLTPYGSMVNYINHAPAGEANVKVVWPQEEMVAHKPDWLERNLTTLRHTIDKIGLSFDYVALRDIKQGEEITMDYGKEWEEAWRKHVMEWEPLDYAEEYVHSKDWPKDEPYRTEAEQDADPYPDNLEFMCIESYRSNPDGTNQWLPVLRKSIFRVHCLILERHPTMPKKKPTYKVELILGEDPETGEENTIVVDNVPHKHIYLTDKVKSGDWHMRNVFRHPIGIPDEIMPEIWKNKKRPGRVPSRADEL